MNIIFSFLETGRALSAPHFLERALAPAPQKLERAHFALLHFLCIKMC